MKRIYHNHKPAEVPSLRAIGHKIDKPLIYAFIEQSPEYKAARERYWNEKFPPRDDGLPETFSELVGEVEE